MHLVELLKEYQGDRNMTEYAADLGLSVPTISTVYSGTRKPDRIVIAAFLRRYPEAAEAVGRAQLADATATRDPEPATV